MLTKTEIQTDIEIGRDNETERGADKDRDTDRHI